MSETIVRRAGEEGVTPFWRRIPRFFLYPLSPGPLLFMLGLACVTLVARFVPLLAIPALLLTALAFLRYCYSVLDRTAFGQLSAAHLGADQYGQYRPWKQLAVFLVYGVLVGLIAVTLGTVPGYIVQYALLLLLPANVMWLGLTNSLLSSLNIVALINIVRAIGWTYLALYGFLALLSAAANTVSVLLIAALGDSLFAFPAIALAQMYFTLIGFNMLGYVLYQYHDRLGLHLTTPAGSSQPLRPRRLREARERPQSARRADQAPARFRTQPRGHRSTLRAGQAQSRESRLQRALSLRAPRHTQHVVAGAAWRAIHRPAGQGRRCACGRWRSTGNAAKTMRASICRMLLSSWRSRKRRAGAGADEVAAELIQDFDQAFPRSPRTARGLSARSAAPARVLRGLRGGAAASRRDRAAPGQRPGDGAGSGVSGHAAEGTGLEVVLECLVAVFLARALPHGVHQHVDQHDAGRSTTSGWRQSSFLRERDQEHAPGEVTTGRVPP